MTKKRDTMLYVVTFAVISLLVIYLYRLWVADFTTPFYFSGDAVFTLASARAGLSTLDYVGMPFGTHLFGNFPTGDGLMLAMMKLVSILFGSDIVSYNLCLLLSFPLTGITTVYALRKFNVKKEFAFVGGLAYAFTTYRLCRLYVHYHLSMYFCLPLLLVIIKEIFADDESITGLIRRDRWKAARLAIFGIMLGTSGIYYAFFACFFIVVCMIYYGIIQKKKHHLFNAAIIVAIIAGALVINMLPSILYQMNNPKYYEDPRLVAENEMYGLRLVQMIMPYETTNIPFVKTIIGKYYENFPISEATYSYMGIFGCFGLFMILFSGIFRIKFKDKEVQRHTNMLTALTVSGIVLATVGGLSVLFTLLVTTQLRAFNRISIILTLFAIAALCIYLSSKKRGSKVIAVICVLLIIVDQVPLGRNPYRWNATNRISDTADLKSVKEFVAELEENVPEGTMIYQLPYCAFPESPGIYRMGEYEHFRPAILGDKYKWSYGANKGRVEGLWNENTFHMGVVPMLDNLSKAGFDGIYIDRFGYADNAEALEERLYKYLGVPIVNKERYAYYDMTGYAASYKKENQHEALDRLAYVLAQDCGYLGADEIHGWILCNGMARLELLNEEGDPVDAEISMGIMLEDVSDSYEHEIAGHGCMYVPDGYSIWADTQGGRIQASYEDGLYRFEMRLEQGINPFAIVITDESGVEINQGDNHYFLDNLTLKSK